MLINYVAIIRPIHSPNPPDCIQLTRTAQSRPLCVSIQHGPPPHICMHPHISHHYPHHTYTSPMLHTLTHDVYTHDQTHRLPHTCTIPHHTPPARGRCTATADATTTYAVLQLLSLPSLHRYRCHRCTATAYATATVAIAAMQPLLLPLPSLHCYR